MQKLSIGSLLLSHSDLKLENILIDDLGYLKVCDFGIAKSISNRKSFVGTTEYISPELVKSDGDLEYGFEHDWWQLVG
jgi:protein kinase A